MAPFLTEGWRIASSGGSCCGCDARFQAGTLFFSGLAEVEAGLARYDFCLDCWSDRQGAPQDEAGGARLFCHWRTRRAAAETKPVVDTDLMAEVFDRLADAQTEERKISRFVLALYLMRRRELKFLRSVRRDDTEVLVFARRGTGAQAEVENPDLTEGQIEAAAARVGQLLDGDLA
jgi:hypothetical protein